MREEFKYELIRARDLIYEYAHKKILSKLKKVKQLDEFYELYKLADKHLVYLDRDKLIKIIKQKKYLVGYDFNSNELVIINTKEILNVDIYDDSGEIVLWPSAEKQSVLYESMKFMDYKKSGYTKGVTFIVKNEGSHLLKSAEKYINRFFWFSKLNDARLFIELNLINED